MNKHLGTFFLFAVSLIIGLLLAEVVSRFVLPVSPGSQILDLSGKPVVLEHDRLRLPRSLQYREVTQEFDVVITVTAQGHRVPVVASNPDIVFIGDSFTLGTGLSDKQTFVAQYCDAVHVTCANLGRGSTGTQRQLDILEDFLESENWRPTELRLFMVVMVSALMAGNDLTDNLSESREAGENHQRQLGSWLAKALSYRRLLLRHSNLARVVYFYFGPQLRTALSPEPDHTELEAALSATEKQLRRLEGIAHHYGFDYKVYLVYPMQDLIRGTHRQTLETILPIVPNRRVVDTSTVLLDDPASYYYPYDGHLNPDGAKRIADFLIREHKAVVTDEENQKVDVSLLSE